MEIDQLETQLVAEKKTKDSINVSVRNLEKKVADLKAEVAQARKQELGCTESEGYKQFQEHVQANAKIEKNISLEKERLKILLERNTDVTEMDLDILSQTELIRLVKQLERIRTDLQSNLREIQVSMDQQAQEILKLNEMKNLYHAEIDLRGRKRRQTISHPTGTAR
ncbi:nesprin-2-like [Planococcus citri]|uniref:nesprin-2-like n=1 Tax=Planococcus citri TaxID=170843 RepID=UPI0031F9DDC9